MEPLLARLAATADLHPEAIPLLDALILLSGPLDARLEPYAPALLQRALALCGAALRAIAGGAADGATPALQARARLPC